MNNALAKRNEATNNLAVIDGGLNRLAKLNMGELRELGEAAVASGMFPDLKTSAQAMMKIMAGHELGFSPIVSMTGVHFFQGRVVIGANLLASLIKDSGKYEYKVLQHTDKVCEIAVFQRFGDDLKQLGTPVYYTTGDASNAGLMIKDNWKKYPKDMLFAACIRQAARRYCADILRGTGTESGNDTEDFVDARAAEQGQIEAPVVETSLAAVEPPADPFVDAEPVQEFSGPATSAPPFGDTEDACRLLRDKIQAKAEEIGEVMLSVGMKKRIARLNELGEEDLSTLFKDISALAA